MSAPKDPEKRVDGQAYEAYAPSSDGVGRVEGYASQRQYLKQYFISREGWIGDYVSLKYCQHCQQVFNKQQRTIYT